MRRTKIVATLGPATDSPSAMGALVKAGVDVVRINFSHGDPDDHRKRVALLRETARKASRIVAVLGDLQGPKIRTARFASGSVILREGDDFILDAALDPNAGTREQVVGYGAYVFTE